MGNLFMALQMIKKLKKMMFNFKNFKLIMNGSINSQKSISMNLKLI